MSLISISFILFLIITIFVFYLAPYKYRWMWLLLCSLAFFYLASSINLLIVIAIDIGIAYLASRLIFSLKSEKAKKIILAMGIILLVAQLLIFKDDVFKYYLNESNISSDFITFENLIAPIGVSYFTLSLIGYCTDVYRESVEPEKNYFRLALFTCYFPILSSGPILRFEEMEEQLFSKRSVDYNSIAFGMQRMLYGFFQKMIIADKLTVVVSTVYSNLDEYSGIYIIFATICYAFRLYADFAGGMNIIMGASECLGIKLPSNFSSPFFSKNISEFWRRWHITLGLWVKDYMLYPMLKSDFFQAIGAKSKRRFNRRIGKAIPTYFALVIVWFTLGVWHGGQPNYMVASGLLPCIYIISSDLLQPFFKGVTRVLRINNKSFVFGLFSMIRTFFLMCICFVFVCAGSVSKGIIAIRQSFVFNLEAFTGIFKFKLGLNVLDSILIFVGLIFILFIDYLKYNGIDFRDVLKKQKLIVRWSVLWAGILVIMFYGVVDGSSFIYFQF